MKNQNLQRRHKATAVPHARRARTTVTDAVILICFAFRICTAARRAVNKVHQRYFFTFYCHILILTKCVKIIIFIVVSYTESNLYKFIWRLVLFTNLVKF